MAKEAEAKIDSTFAILDVKKGRKKLAKHFASRPPFGECPKEMRIPGVITGYIDGQHSRDDGESIEFSIHVEDVKAEF